MAIVDYYETPQRTGKTDRSFLRSYTRVFEVISDDVADGPVTVAAAIGLGLGDTYSAGNDSDAGSFVQDIEAREVERGQVVSVWTVTVQYGGVDPTQGGQADSNPLNDPVEWQYGTNRFERVVDKDINGVPVKNSAGDPFDPPLTIDDSRPVIQATRNEATFSPAAAYAYKDSINSAVWFGGAAGTWKVNNISARQQEHAEIGIYYAVSYEFEYNPLTWKKAILNQGMREMVGSVRKPIMAGSSTEAKTPISSPVPLDAAGLALPPDFDDEDVVYLEFDVYPSVDFSVFNLE